MIPTLIDILTLGPIRRFLSIDTDLISPHGHEVLNDPKKLAKVNKSLNEYKQTGRHDRLIIDL